MEDGGKLTLSSERSVKRLALDFFIALDALEMIASFSPGKAGDEATKTLQKLGVWKSPLVNMETGEVLNADKTDEEPRNLFVERAGHRGEALPEHHQPAGRAGRPRPSRG